MTEAEIIMKRFDNLDLYSKSIVVQCMRKIKPIDSISIERTREDIYYLSEQRANIIKNIIEALETFNTVGGINEEEREKLLKYAEIGNYFCLG
ncbi:hypothetical protein PMY38_06375 [Clostridium tertium]|jgi:hypothetical protein|uniref:hypothetical protein n=1 Tax=Clostridium tertium TaxID=1559 RepID=UPI0018A09913|nr:hypothetical protein [Clostridium tertium]MDB1947691.1 hypothetical protein [Clostridium tertium]MDB1956311.1 hypothetical protein [Clostridium tertium]MDB1958217.1 hypothetical protein [Clostridium tertium]MDB1961597.1 hypothetical protein [Clostridium tertium]MDB1967329.1 hypothetical protein [Clostridium tertium]